MRHIGRRRRPAARCPDLVSYLLGIVAQDAEVGGFKAARIVFEEGQRVFFITRDDALWNIGTEILDDRIFRHVLLSFRFLTSEFFEALEEAV